MPRPEGVAQARADLERRGVLRNLTRRPVVAPLGADEPLTIPAPWWAAAVGWVLLWPAVIALLVWNGSLPGLPWWLPLSLAALHMAALALPVVRREAIHRPDELRRRLGAVSQLPQIMALEPGEFEVWVGMLFQLMGYAVYNTVDAADHGIDLVVVNEKTPRGLVQCKRYRGVVGEPAVRDLYGVIMHENAERGWLVTTGSFSRQAWAWAAGKQIELWDGKMLEALARKYS